MQGDVSAFQVAFGRLEYSFVWMAWAGCISATTAIMPPHCAAQGKKEGVAGRMVKFMVVIAHGKGVVAAIPYSGNINGEKFAGIIDEHFPNLFDHSANAHNRVFLQDGCPSQNSDIARQALGRAKARVFPIPARSPDCNPIENVFHLVKKRCPAEQDHAGESA